MFEKIRIKLKEHQYKKYIDEHRNYIYDAFNEVVTCQELDWIITYDISCKLLERIKVHDLSKYSEEEFNAYRKYYHPINKKEKEESKEEFEKAWKHHLDNNDHHWQSRQSYTELTEEVTLAILENVCDWLAMGYKFNNRPIQYYNKNKENITLPKEQIELLERIINDLEIGYNKTKKYNYGKV